jgi:hypothetical protein
MHVREIEIGQDVWVSNGTRFRKGKAVKITKTQVVVEFEGLLPNPYQERYMLLSGQRVGEQSRYHGWSLTSEKRAIRHGIGRYTECLRRREQRLVEEMRGKLDPIEVLLSALSPEEWREYYNSYVERAEMNDYLERSYHEEGGW